jgi:hypothetical protein
MRNLERQRTDTNMGYYDNEPQDTEAESTIEPTTEGFEPLVSQAAEPSEAEDGDGLVRTQGNSYY